MVVELKITRQRKAKLMAKFPGPKQLKVGFLASQTPPDIMADAILIHYGAGAQSPAMPAQPFIANALRTHRTKYQDTLKSSTASLVRRARDLSTILDAIGAMMQEDIRSQIEAVQIPSGSSPGSSPGSSNENAPIDIAALSAAVGYELLP